MKLLLDQGLPRSTAALLRDGGHPALHVGELGMAAVGAVGPSVIRLRVEGLRAREAAALICRVMERIGDRLRSGVFVTATMDTIRVRSLPIG